MRILAWLKPARSVPATRWRSPGRWSPRPVSLVVLLVGLTMVGTGEALLVQAGLGVSPWTVLAQGVSATWSIPIGTSTFLISAVVLLLWIPLRERPGLGTVANAVVVAAALEAGVQLLPEPAAMAARFGFVVLGIASIGLASGLYLTTDLGPGPRDGWMTGLHLRTGWPVGRVRFGIEVVVLSLGWLMGGTVGIGTVLFALLIGPSVAYGLRLAAAVGGLPGPAGDEAEDFPELDA